MIDVESGEVHFGKGCIGIWVDQCPTLVVCVRVGRFCQTGARFAICQSVDTKAPILVSIRSQFQFHNPTRHIIAPEILQVSVRLKRLDAVVILIVERQRAPKMIDVEPGEVHFGKGCSGIWVDQCPILTVCIWMLRFRKGVYWLSSRLGFCWFGCFQVIHIEAPISNGAIAD